jgi:hypothetical protein
MALAGRKAAGSRRIGILGYTGSRRRPERIIRIISSTEDRKAAHR